MQSTEKFSLAPRSIQSINPGAWSAFVARRGHQLNRVAGSIPPSSFILLSCFIIQVGTALSKSLFASLGAIGTAFICKAIAALFLLVLYRPQLRHHSVRDYGFVLLLGVAIAGMNLSFYSAIERIPLGLTSTLEFMGPLTVAILGSRRWLDLLWVALAGTGVILLAPLTGSTFDPVGITFACLAGVGWAAYILLSVPVGRAFPGGSGLALSMAIGAIALGIPGAQQSGTAIWQPIILAIAIAVAMLNTVLPYSLEFAALKRVPPRIFGVLMSIEPAIAALVGFLFLHETLELQSLIAILLVTSAAIGVTLTGRSNPNH